MFWTDASGTLQKITDHGRAPLSESIERIERKTRLADGTLRRYTVAKKRSWTTSWTNLPSTNTSTTGMKTVDLGWSGKQMEDYYRTQDTSFIMLLRNGSAITKPAPTLTGLTLPHQTDDFYVARVMFADFTKEVVKRGPSDLWEVTVTLEEV